MDRDGLSRQIRISGKKGFEMSSKELISEYRNSRKEQDDFQLTNTISLAADMLFKLAGDAYTPEQEPTVWEMVELLISQYADGRQDDQSN